MSRDSQGNPSQPHCIMVNFLRVDRVSACVLCSLCRKNLGIASADAAGLKELTQSLSGKEAPSKCPLAGWDGPSESLRGWEMP